MKLGAFFAAAAVVCGLSGCDSWLTRPSLYNTVPVAITRRNGSPIAGVGLELYTGQRPMGYGVTDSTGRFVFTRVPQGIYGVVTTTLPTGFEPVERLLGGPPTTVASAFQVAFDSVPTIHFTLLEQGPGAITLRVVSDAGLPIGGLTTQLYSPASIVATTITDSLGRATFANVPFGQYGVLVVRPRPYRDFVTLDDSATSVHDGVVVDLGSRDSLNFVLTKCVGTLDALVVDQTGAPVPLSTLTLYSPTDRLGLLQTGPDGRVSFPNLTCALSMGLHIAPAAGYSVADGRGSSFFDGIVLTKGETAQIVFHVQRQ